MKRSFKVGALAVFIVGTAITFRLPYETLLEPFTVDYEYRFLKKHALALPPQSRLYIFDAPIDDLGLIDAHLIGQFVGSPVSFRKWSEREGNDLFGEESPAYLYVGSSCAEVRDAPGRPISADPNYIRLIQDCQGIQADRIAEVVEQVDVPARKMSWYNFKHATVRLSLYRLSDPSIPKAPPTVHAELTIP